jgi:hypothetical protein
MGVVKSLLLVILVIAGIGAGLIVATKYVPSEDWNGKVVLPANVQPIIAEGAKRVNLGEMTSQLTSNVQSATGKVLGTQDTDPDSDEKKQSLTQKTVNFARYTYCKEVVEEYEKANGKPANQ